MTYFENCLLFLNLSHSVECPSHKLFPPSVVHVLPFVQCLSTLAISLYSPMPEFFAFLKRLPLFCNDIKKVPELTLIFFVSVDMFYQNVGGADIVNVSSNYILKLLFTFL